MWRWTRELPAEEWVLDLDSENLRACGLFFCDLRFSKPQFLSVKFKCTQKTQKAKTILENFFQGLTWKVWYSLTWLCSSRVHYCCFSHWSNCELGETEVWLTGRTVLRVLIWCFQVWLWFTSSDLKNEQKLWSKTNFSNLDQLPPWFFFLSLKKGTELPAICLSV